MSAPIGDFEPHDWTAEASIAMDREIAAADADPVASIIGAGPADLSTWKQTEGVRWLVQGVLAEGGLTLLSSTGGGGKSLLLLDLLVRLAAGTGGSWLDAYALVDRPLRVVLIETENGAQRVRRRLRELVLGDAFDADIVARALPNLRSYHARDIAHPELVIAELGTIHAREQGDLYVIDPLRDFFSRETDDINKQIQVARALAPLIAFVQTHNRAVLSTDHDTKALVAASGSHVKRDTAEQMLHLTAPDPEDSAYLELAIVKDRDYSGAPRRIAVERVSGEPIRTNTDDDVTLYPVRFERTEIRERTAKACDLASRRDRVVETIRQHYRDTLSGLSVRKLAEKAEIGKRRAEDDLRALLAENPPRICRFEERGPVYPIEARASR